MEFVIWDTGDKQIIYPDSVTEDSCLAILLVKAFSNKETTQVAREIPAPRRPNNQTKIVI